MSPEVARLTTGMALALALPMLAIWDCLGSEAVDLVFRWLAGFVYVLMIGYMVSTFQWPQVAILCFAGVAGFAPDILRGVNRVFNDSV